jgi:acyl-coenzyme A synthetase/AMP-(fatty) acid ligase
MQTIYVRDDETQFTGFCDECLTAEATLYAPKIDPNVAGTLPRTTSGKLRRLEVKRDLEASRAQM